MIPPYPAWLKHIFDHEVNVKTPEWYFDDDAPNFSAPPEEIAKLIGQTFSRAGRDLINYTDSQVNQGLSYLVNPACSDFHFALKSAEVMLETRLRAIGNIFNLYSDCFAKRCTESLSHLDEEASDLNPICYMFWDVCPLTYLADVPDKGEIEDCVFSVLEKTLNISHLACREAALHGLSEMSYSRLGSVHGIIDEFLKDATLDSRIRTYAQNAREGAVL
jgi:hypothetical protein